MQPLFVPAQVSVRLCAGLGFSPSPSFQASRLGPLTPPYITVTGRRADSTDSSHYYRPARRSAWPQKCTDTRPVFQVSSWPSHASCSMLGKEKEENAVVVALRQVAGEAPRIMVYPVTERGLFLLTGNIKNGFKVCGTSGITQ